MLGASVNLGIQQQPWGEDCTCSELGSRSSPEFWNSSSSAQPSSFAMLIEAVSQANLGFLVIPPFFPCSMSRPEAKHQQLVSCSTNSSVVTANLKYLGSWLAYMRSGETGSLSLLVRLLNGGDVPPASGEDTARWVDPPVVKGTSGMMLRLLGIAGSTSRCLTSTIFNCPSSNPMAEGVEARDRRCWLRWLMKGKEG